MGKHSISLGLEMSFEVGNEIQLDRGLSAMGTEQSLNEQVGVVARHPNLTPYTRSRQRGFSG